MRLPRIASAAVLAVALALGACGGAPTPSRPRVQPLPVPPADASWPPEVVRLPEVLRPVFRLARVTVENAGSAAERFRDVAVVSRGAVLDVWRRRGSARPYLQIDARNPIDQRLRMLVLRSRLGADGVEWFRILLPIRPNEASGWVRAEDVRLVSLRERVVVDLSERRLTLLRKGRVIQTLSVGIGRPETPTATGRFYVWARVPQFEAAGEYGVYALGISGFSEVLTDWPGGGRMAIHGTPDPGDRGEMVSHGCVRVFNAEMLGLKHLAMGTPVLIRA